MDRQWEKDYVTAENKQEWLEKEISKQEEIQTVRSYPRFLYGFPDRALSAFFGM